MQITMTAVSNTGFNIHAELLDAHLKGKELILLKSNNIMATSMPL